ncbi:MAG: FecR domain-containing protein [Sedimentisphaerales bacterium]|nr:FecR domain-containing protein [Sedimentisphaerales bacterium]
MTRPPLPNMDELLQRLLDDQIEAEEMERLQKAIHEDPRVRDYYINSMLACAVIRRSSQVTGELCESDLIQSLAHGGSQSRSERVRRHLRSIAAVLLFGILVSASVYFFRHMAQEPAIGTLTGEYKATWRGARPRSGELLHAGRYDLREGAVKMELNQGTNLLLEAPCRVELVSADKVHLRSGRLVVVISSEAKYFQVQTPTALIMDLGTEFGVIVHPDGSTEAHVLKGRISVALDPDRSSQPTSLVVNEGQATRVDTTGQTMQSGLASRADIFLLALPSSSQPAKPSDRLDLADIVGGGNGRGRGKVDRGIDLGTGQAFRDPASTIRRARQNEFLPTPQFRGIDGVFVPNGARGPVVISSTGLTFFECPDTLGSYYGGPVNSGKIYDIPSKRIYTARFYGIPLGTPGHPALNLHPNAGITFDLDQIRQDNPNARIDRFTAVCGIPKDLPQSPFSPADVWILLDGIVCRHLHFPVGRYAVEQVDVPIPAQTRFLTVVAACSGRADYSWVFFGDPYLEPAATVQEEVNN